MTETPEVSSGLRGGEWRCELGQERLAEALIEDGERPIDGQMRTLGAYIIAVQAPKEDREELVGVANMTATFHGLSGSEARLLHLMAAAGCRIPQAH